MAKILSYFMFFALVLPSGLKAQSPKLQAHEAILARNKLEYSSFIDSSGLSKILRVDSLEIKESTLTAHLFCSSKKQWTALEKNWNSAKPGLPVSIFLMQSLSFVTDMDTRHLKVQINCPNATILIANDGKATSTDVTDFMGDIITAPVLTMAEAPSAASGSLTFTCKPGGKDELYTYLFDNLKQYFSNYAVKFAAYNCEEFPTDELLKIDVSNVTKVVIDNGYFEHLTVLIKVDTSAAKCVLYYSVWGKYSSGVIWSPREDRYHPMIPVYNNQLVVFNSRFNSELYKILKKL